MSDSTMISAVFAGIGELFLTLALKNLRKSILEFLPKVDLDPKNPPPKVKVFEENLL